MNECNKKNAKNHRGMSIQIKKFQHWLLSMFRWYIFSALFFIHKYLYIYYIRNWRLNMSHFVIGMRWNAVFPSLRSFFSVCSIWAEKKMLWNGCLWKTRMKQRQIKMFHYYFPILRRTPNQKTPKPQHKLTHCV